MEPIRYGEVPASPDRPAARRGFRLPPWLAIGLIAAVAGGSGWAGWRWLNPAPVAVDLSQYEPNAGGLRTRPPNPNGPAAALRRSFAAAATGPAARPFVNLAANGNGSLLINGVNVRFVKNGADYALRVDAGNYGGPVPLDRQALRARASALGSTLLQKSIPVTPDQVAKLKAIPVPEFAGFAPEVQTRLLSLWSAYMKADTAGRASIDRVMADRVRQAITATEQKDATAFHTAAEQVRAILPADQINKLRAVPRPATTAPSPGMAGRGLG